MKAYAAELYWRKFLLNLIGIEVSNEFLFHNVIISMILQTLNIFNMQKKKKY